MRSIQSKSCIRIISVSLLFLWSSHSNVLFAQKDWATYSASGIKLSDTLLIKDLPKYKMILVGETHGVSSNKKTQLALLKYFYKQSSVRNILIESSYASSFLLNKYLQTGDENLICININFHPSEEAKEFWRSLYEFNKSNHEKIQVIGIDDQVRYSSWFKAMVTLFSDVKTANLTPKISEMINKIRKGDSLIVDPRNIPFATLSAIKSEFVNSYTALSVQYREILGKDYKHLALILKTDLSRERNKYTNRNMAANLLRIIAAGESFQGNYFGQFGSAHIQKNKKSLSSILHRTKHHDFHNSILVIQPRYFNCQYLYVSRESGKLVFSNLKVDDKKRKKIDSSSDFTLISQKSRLKSYPKRYYLQIMNQPAENAGKNNCL